MMGNLQESFSFMHGKRGAPVRPPFEPVEAFRLAAQGIYLGTSSWKYRGWEGLIYQGGYVSEAQFQRASLREYTAVLPCVGVDFTYFSWPSADMMAYLVESTPENFRLCPKVTKRITLSTFPNLPAYGKWAGQKNPEFLNSAAFEEKFLEPVRRLKDRMGLVQFEFSGPSKEDLPALRAFFEKIPRDFQYAVEIRNPELVTADFYRFLMDMGLSAAFSFWTRMPSLGQQFQAYLEAGGAKDKNPVLGLGILRPGRTYEDSVQLFSPYQEVRDLYQDGRDQLFELGLWARKNERKAFILVNNRLEGSAPHTIGSVLGRLSAEKTTLL